MESDTDDGRSSVSQPRNESPQNPQNPLHYPVRIEIPQNETPAFSGYYVHELPQSSHSLPVRSRRYSLTDKIIIFLSIIISMLVLVVFGILAWKRLVIWYTAYKINRHIDFDVDPCDDFYKFACGRFIKKFEPHIGSSSYSQFDNIIYDLRTQTKALLEKSPKENELPIIKKTKTFYHVCTDIDNINKKGVDPLKDLLIKELGGWPLTYGEWKESNFDLATTLANLNLILGFSPLLILYVGVDIKNNHKRTLKIQPPEVILIDRNAYLFDRNNTQLMAYEELITGIATVLGLADKTSSSEDIKAIVDFEIKMVEILKPLLSDRGDKIIYNPMTLEDVQGNYSQILNWTRYLNTLMSIPEVQIDITDQEVIMNEVPLYFEKLEDVMRNTTAKTIANYVIWTFVYYYIRLGMVGTMFKENFDKYGKSVPGIPSTTNVEHQCVEFTWSVLPLPVGRLFIEKHFDQKAKTIATEMVTELKKAFGELLEESDWLDEETKKYAEEKKNLMSTKIGFPEYLYNNTYIEETYTWLEVGYSFFDNMKNFYRHDRVKNLLELRKPVDKEEWIVPPTTTNAFHVPYLNEIMLPAGILQPPIFTTDHPKSMNFGGIGTVIGHEITHGFDDQGRHYGKDGNLHDWWSDEAEEKFKNKSQCMIDQYGNFTLETSKIKANGVRTLGENIADNGGLKQAFRAYRNWVKSHGKEEQRLPDLNFTHNQLFFISFAQSQRLRSELERFCRGF